MTLELIITLIIGASVPVGALIVFGVLARNAEREASKHGH